MLIRNKTRRKVDFCVIKANWKYRYCIKQGTLKPGAVVKYVPRDKKSKYTVNFSPTNDSFVWAAGLTSWAHVVELGGKGAAWSVAILRH